MQLTMIPSRCVSCEFGARANISPTPSNYFPQSTLHPVLLLEPEKVLTIKNKVVTKLAKTMEPDSEVKLLLLNCAALSDKRTADKGCSLSSVTCE